MKRILVILGGGRPKGNTRQLAGTFIQGAVDAGHEVELVSLSQVEVKSCIGCNTCRYGKPCVQKDGFSELVLKIKAADLLVFASPLLFWTISAKLMTSADDLFWTYEQAVSCYKFTIIHYIGFHDKGMLLAGGCGDTNGKPQISKTNHLKEAYKFGKTIYQE